MIASDSLTLLPQPRSSPKVMAPRQKRAHAQARNGPACRSGRDAAFSLRRASAATGLLRGSVAQQSCCFTAPSPGYRYGTNSGRGSMRISVNWPDDAPETESFTAPASVRPLTRPAKARLFS